MKLIKLNIIKSFIILALTLLSNITIGQTLISDSVAINTVINLPEVTSDLNAHKNDSTVSNKIYIDSHPNETNNFYLIRLSQFFTYSDHSVTIELFKVDADTGHITVLDMIEGKYITLEQWRAKK